MEAKDFGRWALYGDPYMDLQKLQGCPLSVIDIDVYMVATIVLVVSNKPIQSSMNNTSSD